VIVRSTIDLPQYGMSVVAKAWNPMMSSKRLSEWHCDMGQGYYLGLRPIRPFFALMTHHGCKSSIATASFAG